MKRLLLITALILILGRAEAASKYFFKSAKSVLYVAPPSATASADVSDQIAEIFESSDWSFGESDDKVNDKANASNDKTPSSFVSEDIGETISDELKIKARIEAMTTLMMLITGTTRSRLKYIITP